MKEEIWKFVLCMQFTGRIFGGSGMADEISIVLDGPPLCFDLNNRTPTRHLPTFRVLPLYLWFVFDIYQFETLLFSLFPHLHGLGG
jgi:hypothetical protein